MTKENLSKVLTTKCITCDKIKPDTEFYARRPDECMDCVDYEYQPLYKDASYIEKLHVYRGGTL